MKTMKISKDSSLCIASAVIIVLAYAAEKILELTVDYTKNTAIVLAMVNTVLLACVTVILGKSRDSFSGLLAALIGYKMMPVPISFISDVSEDGAMLYYIVRKAAMVIFIVLVFRLYQMQEKPRAIKPLPLLAILFAVPFFSEIGVTMTDYFLSKTGSLLFGFFSKYACYIVASLIILALAFISGYASMRFAAYFEFAALGINILRMAGKIAVKLTYNVHISRSLYGWVIVYAALIACFTAALIIKKKKA